MSDAGAEAYNAAKGRDLSREELLERIEETREDANVDPEELEAVIRGDEDDE